MSIFILKKIHIVLLLLTVLGGGLFVMTHVVGAQESVYDLRKKISDSKTQLAEIEKEIQKYQTELNTVGSEKKTLQNAIRELDLSRDKVKAEIRATEKKISSTDLEIEELDREIYIKDLELKKNTDAVVETFRRVDQMESKSLVEVVFSNESMADMWDDLEQQTLLQDSLRESTKILLALKNEYERAMNDSLEKKDILGELKKNLSGEENSLKSTIGQKD
jgi:cell division protein FtsL